MTTQITKADLTAALKGLARRLPCLQQHEVSLETYSPGDGKRRYRVAAQPYSPFNETKTSGSGSIVYPLGHLYMVGASEAYEAIWRAINLLDFIGERKRNA